MIVSLNLDEDTVRKLDELAGPRQRSAWIRTLIASEHEKNVRMTRLVHRINSATRRKATTPRKKAA